jgi:hypothetical protein
MFSYHTGLLVCADKSLSRPARKQATATQLGIHSTYSPWSWIHFVACCSNFCKPLKKKKIQKVVLPTRSPRQQRSPCRTKSGDLSIVFAVQGIGDSPTGPDPENSVGCQDTLASFFWVASARWAGALSCKNKTPLATFPRRFSFKFSFSYTSRDK